MLRIFSKQLPITIKTELIIQRVNIKTLQKNFSVYFDHYTSLIPYMFYTNIQYISQVNFMSINCNFSQDYGLAPLVLCVLILYMSGGTYSRKKKKKVFVEMSQQTMVTWNTLPLQTKQLQIYFYFLFLSNQKLVS